MILRTKKIKAEEWAKELKKANGLDGARRITKIRANASKPEEWGNIPTGPVFYPKSKRGSESLNTKHLTYLHNYWTQVYNVLQKMEK